MSKARLVITAVTIEKRPAGEVAREYQVGRSWIYALLARYQAEGEAAFVPAAEDVTGRDRRREGRPDRPAAQGTRRAGHGRRAAHDPLAPGAPPRHHRLGGDDQPVPVRPRPDRPRAPQAPESSCIRFQAEQPDECWQSGFTNYPLADGIGTEILSWLDDHSRYALSITAHDRVTGRIVLNAFQAAVAAHGAPAATLTDNGMVFTTRFSGGKGGRNGLETELRSLGITQKNGKPNHPKTQGKAERFQQTLKNWLAAQNPQATNLAQLQELLGTFATACNTRRPHRSLPHHATPATAYAARPKAAPGNRDTDTHHRVRTDRIDDTGTVTLRHHGRLYHIGIGRNSARTRVLLLVQDLHIRIINAATGELLRELTLDTTRNYQPTGRPKEPPKGTPGPPRKTQNPEP